MDEAAGSSRDRRPALLRRLPRTRVAAYRPVPAAGAATEYPALADDLALLEKELVPGLMELEHTALTEQNRYRRQQVLLLALGMAATAAGAAQAAWSAAAVPGVVAAVVASTGAAVTGYAQSRRSLTRFQRSRQRAEALKSLYFRYVTRTGPFAGPGRERALVKAVAQAQRGRLTDG